MDIRQLRYFACIVEHGSISRAAEVLRIAQPALSGHLKRLEEEFGCPLVLRTARGIVPTESGRHLARRAADLVETVASLRDEIRGVEAAPSGPAVVGIPTSLGPLLTVPLALAVRRAYPAIRLRVAEGLSGHMLEWVLSGQVDLALVFDDGETTGLTTEFVARERLRLVGPRGDQALAGRDEITLQEALGLPLILPGRPHGVRQEVERAALLCRVPVNVTMEIDAINHIKVLVAEGIGYTIMSKRTARYGQRARSLADALITSPEIERTIQLAHASNRPLPAAARAVQTIARDLLNTATRAGIWH